MFFSKDLYIQGLKKIRTVGIGSAATVILLNIFYAYTRYEGRSHYYYEVDCGRIAPFAFLTALFSIGLVSSMFSFLNKRRDSDFYHSIPQKRLCVYFSFIVAVITWIAGINLLTIIINSFFIEACPGYHVPILNSVLAFIGYTVSALVAASVATVCRMLAGTGVAYFFYTASFFIVPRILILIFNSVLNEFNHSIILNDASLGIFSNEYSLYFTFSEFGSGKPGNFANPLLLFSLFLESAIFFAIGARLYQKRRSELAGQSKGSKKVHAFFRTLVVLPMLYVASVGIFINPAETYIWVMLGLSLLFHFLFELIMSKNAKKAFTGMVTFIIPLIVSAGLVGYTLGVAEFFRETNPEVDEISYITIENRNGYHEGDIYIFMEKEYVTCFDFQFSSETAKETVTKALEATSKGTDGTALSYSYPDNSAIVKFSLKDGKEISRIVYFSNDEMELILREVNNILKER
ncbi:MAG: hypothetical protein E7614_08495 [Ruminococcaceae bacterium]|nr:hypothetical protein [Oscillospiraceae bacterium]